jgi:hypothetical protein
MCILLIYCTHYSVISPKYMQLAFSRFPVGFSLRRIEISSKVVHVRFETVKVTLRPIFLQHFRFLLPIIILPVLHVHLTSSAFGKISPSWSAVPQDSVLLQPHSNNIQLHHVLYSDMKVIWTDRLCTYLSMALQPLVGPWPFFQFLIFLYSR